MRLSPVLVAVVAMTTSLSGTLPASGQTSDSSSVGTEQLNSLSSTPDVSQQVKNQNNSVIEASPVQPAAIALPEVIVQSSTTPTTTKTKQLTPETTAKPPAASDIVLPEAEQQTPSQTGDTTSPNLVVQSSITPKTAQTKQLEPETTPEEEAPAAPDLAPLDTQQQTPNQTPPDITSPEAEPGTPTPPTTDQPAAAPEQAEPRVLVSEVVVTSAEGQLPEELQSVVYQAIGTQAGRTTSRAQLQEDINAIFATGFFSDVRAVPEDTPLGVRVSFFVDANPVLREVNVQTANANVPSVLSAEAVNKIFQEQYGEILNFRSLQEGIKQLNELYQEQGYVLAQIVGAPQVTEEGIVTLQVAQGVVEDIRVRFRNKEGEETDEQGRPIGGRTRPYIITRELELGSGQVFNRNIVQRDLQRVFGLGLFEDVNISLEPGEDPTQVDVVVNVIERNSGSIAAGAGISSASGLFGTLSYQEQNLFGRNQRLGGELQVGQRELLFDLRYTDPWIAGDPYRTSYTANLFRRRSISLIFDGDEEEIELVGTDDRPRILRLGGGVTFTRPLSRNVFRNAEWTAVAGLQYQRISIRDDDGEIIAFGEVDDQPGRRINLSASGEGKDDLLTLQLGAVRDRRNSALLPTTGSFLRLGVEQSVPVGLGNIFLTRLRGTYSQYVPVNFTNFAQGSETLALTVQAGTVLGDLPPYEAFSLGGSNSVRGYDEGDLGSGRSFVQATAEYRFPVISAVSGVVFLDVGSDLGTSTEPAELLGKDGSGFGYGLGVRVQSPLGPIRVDYGINDEGNSRIHFGIGERF